MTKENEEHIKLSSVPIRKIGKNLIPTGCASGCLIDYKGKRILLTVHHATGDMGNWAIEIRYVPGKGTQLYQLSGINFLKTMDLDTMVVKDVDFAYVAVPDGLESFYQEFGTNYEIVSEIPRKICKVNFDLEPSRSETYGFSGLVKTKFDGIFLAAEHKMYLDLKFIEKDGDFLVFELPMKHPGHGFFKGCSGAPITDAIGNTVALVCGGDIETNCIFGISLKKYQMPIEINYGDLAR